MAFTEMLVQRGEGFSCIHMMPAVSLQFSGEEQPRVGELRGHAPPLVHLRLVCAS